MKFAAFRRPALAAATLLGAFLPAAAAWAHPGHEHAEGFLSGLLHPVTGPDHLLAMIAVGLWAARLGGRALWAVPLAFLGAMALGGVLGLGRPELGVVEWGIAGSVLVLGVLIAAAVRLPLAAGAGLVGLFALCHGYAHGTEMPLNADAGLYGLGFLLATAALHGLGLAAGLRLGREQRLVPAVRVAGGLVAVAGAWMLLV